MIRSLRRKFVLIMMGLVSLILLAVLGGICLFFADSLRKDGYRMLEMAINRPPNQRPPNFTIGGKVPDGFSDTPVFVVRVHDDRTISLYMSEYIDVDEAQLPTIVDEVLQRNARRGELREYALRYVLSKQGPETKIAFMTLSLEKTRIFSIFWVTTLAVLGALLVFFAARVLLSYWALRPVENAWQKQRRFVSDASHELKTPLTVILANTGILKSHPDKTIAEQSVWVNNTQAEAQRMKKLVDNLLFLAKSDDVAANTPPMLVNLIDAVSTMALSFEPVAFEHQQTLEADIAPDIHVNGNAQQLRQLTGILLDNAVKYGKPQSVIRLQLKEYRKQAELSVFSEGKQIPAEAQAHLFDRFYRADPSRVQQGYGLGLSIAKTITDDHFGKTSVSSFGNGSTFTVTIPLTI